MTKYRTDLENEVYEKLTFVEFVKFGMNKDSYWVFKCECGNYVVFSLNKIFENEIKSCGCDKEDFEKIEIKHKHGFSEHRLYVVWMLIKKQNKQTQWKNIKEFANWSFENGYKKDKILVLKDSKKGYVEKNCFWCYKHEKKDIKVKPLKEKNESEYYKLKCVYNSMKQRCNNTNNPTYKYYGGRGIKISEKWSNFENFYFWATNNGYEKGLTIDRINNDESYSPENCRWATRKIQCNNRRTVNMVGDTGMSLKIYCELNGLNIQNVKYKIKKGTHYKLIPYEIYKK